MRIEERIEVPVSGEDAWRFLWQTQRLAACLPGCVAVREVYPSRRYQATFEDHIGPYAVRFEMAVTVEKAEPPSYLRLHVFGEDRRLGASQNADLDVTVQPLAPGRTAIAVVAEVQIIGKVATLGQSVIKRKAKQVLSEFAKNVDRELRGTVPAGSSGG